MDSGVQRPGALPSLAKSNVTRVDGSGGEGAATRRRDGHWNSVTLHGDRGTGVSAPIEQGHHRPE